MEWPFPCRSTPVLGLHVGKSAPRVGIIAQSAKSKRHLCSVCKWLEQKPRTWQFWSFVSSLLYTSESPDSVHSRTSPLTTSFKILLKRNCRELWHYITHSLCACVEREAHALRRYEQVNSIEPQKAGTLQCWDPLFQTVPPPVGAWQRDQISWIGRIIATKKELTLR